MKQFRLLLLIALLSAIIPTSVYSQKSEWKVFTRENTTQLGDNRVNYIYIDKDNIKWASSGRSLTWINSDIWKNVGKNLASELGQIVIDSKDSIWMTTEANGIWTYYDNKGGKFTNYSGKTIFNSDELSADSTTAIAIDNSGKIWVGSKFGLAYTSNDGGTWNDMTYILFGTSNSVTSIVVDATGTIWIGTTNGLVKYSNNVPTIIQDPLIVNKYIKALNIDKDNHLWVANKSGLAYFNGSNWSSVKDPNASQNLFNNITAIAVDKTNTLYLGFSSPTPNDVLDTMLVYKFGNVWNYYYKNSTNLPQKNIKSIAIDTNDNIWVATYGGGIAVKFIDTIKADFEPNTYYGESPLNVQFTDKSIGNIKSWYWTFGDGGTSDLQHPNHVFTKPGVYKVWLKVCNEDYCDSIPKEITVYSKDSITCKFDLTDVLWACKPDSILFTDKSTANPAITSWKWDFGDGKTSYDTNPWHVYNTSGTYTVKLVVSNGSQKDSKSKTVKIKIINTDFTADTVEGEAPINAHFTDMTTGSKIVKWEWNFGDAGVGVQSNEQNPYHTFQKPGFYTVELCVTDVDGTVCCITKKVEVTKPKGKIYCDQPIGDNLQGGEDYEIRWEAIDVECVKIYVEINGGGYQLIGTKNPTKKYDNFIWSVPFVNSNHCKYKIEDCNDPSIFCEGEFSIVKSGTTIEHCKTILLCDLNHNITGIRIDARLEVYDTNYVRGTKNILPDIDPSELGLVFSHTDNGIVKGRFVCPIDSISCDDSTYRTEQPVTFGLLVDRSGSMDWAINEPYDLTKRMTALKSSLNNFIDKMRDVEIKNYDTIRKADQAYLMSFATDVRVDQKMTSNKGLLKNSLNHLTANGATHLYEGLDQAIDSIKNQPVPRALILLSDGGNFYENGYKGIYSKVIFDKLKNLSDIPIYIIALGLSQDTLDVTGRDTMQMIADKSGGRLFDVYNSEKLDEIYEKLVVELTTYKCCRIYFNDPSKIEPKGWVKLIYSPTKTSIWSSAFDYDNNTCIVVDTTGGIIENNDDPFDVSVAPNPINQMATLTYNLMNNGEVKIIVTDLLGNRIASLDRGYQGIGEYQYRIDGSKLASGTYMAVVMLNGQAVSRKIVVLH
jgi:PKD repeat protein